MHSLTPLISVVSMMSKNPSECGTPFDIQHTSFFYDELLLLRDQPSGWMIHTPSTTRDCLFALHPRAIRPFATWGRATSGDKRPLRFKTSPKFAERPMPNAQFQNHYAFSQWVNSSKRNAVGDYSALLLWIREVLYSNPNPQTSCHKTPLGFRLFHQYLKITRSSSFHILSVSPFT